jgi:hypothetical protein
VTTEEIARHEAGHAAMAIFLGIDVRYMGFAPDGGIVEYGAPFSHTPEGAVYRMMIVLGGLIESARDGDDIPDWPIDPDAGRNGEQHDRQMLKTLGERLRFTDSEWRRILIAALTVSTNDFYRALVVAACGLLDHTPIIDRALLGQAIAIAERNT